MRGEIKLLSAMWWGSFLLIRCGLGILGLLPRRTRHQLASASIWQVELLEEGRFGRAKVRLVYSIPADDGSSFYAVRETRATIAQLPQVGERVTVRFDPSDRQNFEILDTFGSETYGGADSIPRA